jgi:hypothetical protein
MVAQNFALDSQLDDYQLRVDEIITFGSPIIAPRADGTKYVYVEHVGDLVLSRLRNHNLLFGRERKVSLGGDFKRVEVTGGPGRPDLLWGHHGTYHNNDELKLYDVVGQKNTRYWLEVDLNSFVRHAAPRVVGTKKPDSELIGETAMNQMAKNLGYDILLSPNEASNYRQGYDGIYWDPKSCAIVIGEAKGGYNGQSVDEILGTGYGFRQGTIDWARAAAQRITRSRTVYDSEVWWAEIILCIIGTLDRNSTVVPFRSEMCGRIRQCNASLRVEVFHTEITNGQPKPTKRRITDRYP